MKCHDARSVTYGHIPGGGGNAKEPSRIILHPSESQGTLTGTSPRSRSSSGMRNDTVPVVSAKATTNQKSRAAGITYLHHRFTGGPVDITITAWELRPNKHCTCPSSQLVLMKVSIFLSRTSSRRRLCLSHDEGTGAGSFIHGNDFQLRLSTSTLPWEAT